MNIVDNSKHKAGLEALKCLQHKEISIAEFETEMAYFVLDCGFEELKPSSGPTAPEEKRRFNILLPYEKEKFLKDNPEFFKTGKLYGYLENRKIIKYKNKSNLEWLQKIFNWIPEGDIMNRQKIRKRIIEFQDRMRYEN